MMPWAWWKLSFFWFLNLESRAPGGKRTLVSGSIRGALFGLGLGVAALLVTLGIFRGFDNALATSLSGSLGHVTAFTGWKTFDEIDKMIAHAPPGVARAIPFWTTQGLVVGPQGGRGVMIEGRARTGRTFDPASGRVSVDLGATLAESLGLKLGDRFRILLPGILNGSVEAEVSGLIRSGMYDIDSRSALVIDESLRAVLAATNAPALHDRPGDAHGIRFQLDPTKLDARSEDGLNAWVNSFRTKLGAAGLDGANDVYRTWRELQRNLIGSIGVDKFVLIVIMGLVVCVATLNVAATLVVLFLERDREIAVLRAIGLSRGGLTGWIATQGFMLGVAGSLVGLALAAIAAWGLPKLPWAQLPPEIYHIGALPMDVSAADAWGAVLFGTLASVVLSTILGRHLATTPYLASLGQRR